MDDKTLKAVDKMLGIKEYGVIFWIQDAVGNRMLEKRIKIRAKTYDEAYHIGVEEYDKFCLIYPNERHEGYMDKTRTECGE